VLDFERDVLIGAGAEVVCLRSADEAIAALAAETFDGLLVDSSMPGEMSGLDLFQWICTNLPDYRGRFILAFSNANEQGLREMIEQNGIPFISKPFEVSELIAVMSGVLKSKKSTAAV